MTKKVFLNILALLLAVVMFVDPAQVFAAANEYSNEGATYKVNEVVDEYDLGFGVKYHREISATKRAGYSGFDAQQVNVLEITPSSEVQLVPYAYLADDQWNAIAVKKAAIEYETRYPGYKVVAAVNGDYFKINDYVRASTGVTIGQGEFYKTISDHGGVNSIAIRNNGSGKQLFTTKVTSQVPVLAIYDENNNIIKEFNISKVNQEPADNEIAVYYAQREKNFGQYVVNEKASDVWFVERGEITVTSRKDSFYGVGKISGFVNGETEVGKRSFAIKTNNKEVNDLLAAGTKIRVQYEFNDPSVEGIENFIGFPFTIIEDKKVINADTNRHPRTIIGQRENGDVILAVIDGRQNNKGMYGVNSYEMAAILGYYGCVDGWNLDGGGSSTLIVRKQPNWTFGNENNGFNINQSEWYVTNNPSDGNERSDGNHLLVVVKMPEVTVDIESATETTIVLNVMLLSELDKYKNLYILFGKEYYEVKEGKVTITGLKKNTEYDFWLYAKVGDQYINLMNCQSYSTSKTKPTDISVTVSLLEKDGKVQILFRYKVDFDEAVRTIVFIDSNGERYLSASKTLLAERSKEIYEMINDGKIEINYLVNKLFPEEQLIIEEFDIKFDSMYIIDEILFMNNDSVLDIFK